MTEQNQPSPEAIKIRQQKMLEVWEGIKEKAKPENDQQHAQALAFALVDLAEYVNDMEQQYADDRKFMEDVIAHMRRLESHNVDLMTALGGSHVRDVWKVDVQGGKCNVVRAQDGLVLGTFGLELAEQLVAKLNIVPVAPAVEQDGA